MSESERILVVRAGALGDTLMTTPVLRALRERFPDKPVDVLCSSAAAPLLELRPGRGELLPLRHRNLPHLLSLEKRRLVRKLRSQSYTFAVLLERSPRYRSLLERAGIERIRSFREHPFDPRAHAIVNNLRAAGLDDSAPDQHMEVFLGERDRLRADRLLQGMGTPRVGVHLGYGPRGKKRNQGERLKGWAASRFEELGRALVARGIRLVFTGSEEDRADVSGLASRLDGLDLAGRTTVRELAAVIEKLDVFVSVDSGPAHLAAALGTPLVVLWGPAILEQVRPLSSRAPVVIVRHAPPCAPCYETPLMKTCRRNVCMEAITPAEVEAEVTRLLAEGAQVERRLEPRTR